MWQRAVWSRTDPSFQSLSSLFVSARFEMCSSQITQYACRNSVRYLVIGIGVGCTRQIPDSIVGVPDLECIATSLNISADAGAGRNEQQRRKIDRHKNTV